MYWHRKLAYYRSPHKLIGGGGGLGEQSLMVRPVTMLMLYCYRKGTLHDNTYENFLC